MFPVRAACAERHIAASNRPPGQTSAGASWQSRLKPQQIRRRRRAGPSRATGQAGRQEQPSIAGLNRGDCRPRGPASAYLGIIQPSCSFLLASVRGGKKWARYTFLDGRAAAARRVRPPLRRPCRLRLSRILSLGPLWCAKRSRALGLGAEPRPRSPGRLLVSFSARPAKTPHRPPGQLTLASRGSPRPCPAPGVEGKHSGKCRALRRYADRPRPG